MSESSGVGETVSSPPLKLDSGIEDIAAGKCPFSGGEVDRRVLGPSVGQKRCRYGHPTPNPPNPTITITKA